MPFTDLPDDWSSRPITDPDLIEDVLDLVVSLHDRHRGAIVLLLCDRDGRLRQPVTIGEPPVSVGLDEAEQMLRVFVEVFTGSREGAPDAALMVVVARPHGLVPVAADRVWRRATQRVCAAAGWLDLGTYLVTNDATARVTPRRMDVVPPARSA